MFNKGKVIDRIPLEFDASSTILRRYRVNQVEMVFGAVFAPLKLQPNIARTNELEVPWERQAV